MEKVIERTQNHSSPVREKFGVLGAKFNLGQKREGVEQAIDYLREYNLLPFLHHFFEDVVDYGDVRQDIPNTYVSDPQIILSNMRRLYRECLSVLNKSDRALFVGGDHSVGMATVAAVKSKYPDAIIIWMDAHADMNTPEQSLTKSLHGMPMAFLTGIVDSPRYAGFSEFNGVLEPNDVIYLGLRDLDKAEVGNLKSLGVEAHSTISILKHGIAPLLQSSLQKIDPYGERPIHLSFDIDCLDPIWAPCTGVPAEEGLSLIDVNEMSMILQKTGRLKSFDFVELNPLLAQNRVQLTQSMRVLYHLIGGLFPYLDKYELGRTQLLN
ncbi:MAG: arginase [Bdellovibrionales bacterium]